LHYNNVRSHSSLGYKPAIAGSAMAGLTNRIGFDGHASVSADPDDELSRRLIALCASANALIKQTATPGLSVRVICQADYE
jgi:hypothetical protein